MKTPFLSIVEQQESERKGFLSEEQVVRVNYFLAGDSDNI